MPTEPPSPSPMAAPVPVPDPLVDDWAVYRQRTGMPSHQPPTTPKRTQNTSWSFGLRRMRERGCDDSTWLSSPHIYMRGPQFALCKAGTTNPIRNAAAVQTRRTETDEAGGHLLLRGWFRFRDNCLGLGIIGSVRNSAQRKIEEV